VINASQYSLKIPKIPWNDSVTTIILPASSAICTEYSNRLREHEEDDIEISTDVDRTQTSIYFAHAHAHAPPLAIMASSFDC